MAVLKDIFSKVQKIHDQKLPRVSSDEEISAFAAHSLILPSCLLKQKWAWAMVFAPVHE